MLKFLDRPTSVCIFPSPIFHLLSGQFLQPSLLTIQGSFSLLLYHAFLTCNSLFLVGKCPFPCILSNLDGVLMTALSSSLLLAGFLSLPSFLCPFVCLGPALPIRNWTQCLVSPGHFFTTRSRDERAAQKWTLSSTQGDLGGLRFGKPQTSLESSSCAGPVPLGEVSGSSARKKSWPGA